MKRGLVIGKFMPIHRGHIALINFAAAQCDELIVSMSYTIHDPISAELRFLWIKEIFRHLPTIKPHMVKDDFDDESLPLDVRTNVWSDFIERTYPPVEILFSSEEYGEPFAKNLGAEHRSFDPERKNFPVSASRIRNKPFQYWDFIPPVVRPYFVKKICFYGPESTGKSTMAVQMAKQYQTAFVPEVARELITSNDFTVEDIIRIGYAHLQRIEEKSQAANKILFCDTDTITTQIYSCHYLKVVPDVLYVLEKKVQYDVYFLMDIDVPWVADGLRDLGQQREAMMGIFKQELVKRGISYIPVKGTHKQREDIICKEIDRLLN
jgi:HTH-type transcriptional regulator, transcriptional repressor of NAD biosynthesis genes